MPVSPIDRVRRAQGARNESTRSPYQRLYQLREHPFPSQAMFTAAQLDPRQNGLIYDAQFREEEERAFFERFLEPPAGEHPPRLGFIRLDPQAGGRGNGKSTFLHHITQRMNQQQWKDWPEDPNNPALLSLAVHVLPEPTKHKNFWEFIRLVFTTLGEHRMHNLELVPDELSQGSLVDSPRLLTDINVQLRAAVLLQLLTPEDIDTLAQSEELTEKLRTTDGFSALLARFHLTEQAYSEQLFRGIDTHLQGKSRNGFLKDLEKKSGDLEALWEHWKDFFRNDYQWQKNGIDWLVNGLAPVLLVAGYQRFYILLDEFEKIYISQNSRKRDEFLDGLRQYFFERSSVAVNFSLCSVVLTIHPSIYKYLQENWVRVGLEGLAPLNPRQMSACAIELGPSTFNKLTHLLTVYLDFYRDEGALPEYRGTPYPFEVSALKRLIDEARSYPRDTLRLAFYVLQKAATENVQPPISGQYIEQFLRSNMLQRADADDLMVLPEDDTNLSQ